MKQLTRFVILSGAAALAACASQPPVTTTWDGTSPQRIAADAAAAWQTPSVAHDGTRRIVVNGQEKLCRSFLVTGSRAEKTEICLTQAQWDSQQDSSQAFIQGIQRSGGIGVRPYILTGLAPPQ